MSYVVGGAGRIRWSVIASALFSVALLALSIQLAGSAAPASAGAGNAAGSGVPVSPKLERMAHDSPATRVQVIAQFERATSTEEAKRLVWRMDGHVSGELHIFNGLVAELSAAKAYALAKQSGVHAVSLNAKVKKNSLPDYKQLATSFNESAAAPPAWFTTRM